MSNLQLFQFDSQDIEIILINEQFWFNASQAAKALGYANPSKALQDNVSAKYNQQLDLNRRGSKPNFISEPGLYQLIMRSNLPNAERFQDWVFEQVLPQIRKTGSYSIQPEQKRCYYYERYVEFITNNKVPTGYFTIFEETLRLVGQLESKNYVLPKSALPDGSVGRCWANYLKGKGIKLDSVAVKYSYKFPNDPRGTVQAWAYPNEMLADFRKWFETTYKFEKLGNYLKSRQPDALPALSQLLDVPQSVMKQLVG
jgi:prophage antirepressor-like protein